MTEGYSNITITKVTTFGLIAITAFFWMLLLRYMDMVSSAMAYSELVSRLKRLDILDILLWSFLFANVITCICSGRVLDDMIAAGDKHIGLVYAILLFMIMMSVRYSKIEDFGCIFEVMSLGTAVAIIVAVLQFMGGDLFGLIGSLSKLEAANFLSTIGNTAVFGKYICIVCPVAIYYLGDRTDALSKACFYLISMLFPMGVIVSNTDASVIGMVVAAVVAFILALYYGKVSSYILSFMTALVGILFLGIVYHIVPGRRNASGIVRLFLNYRVLAVIMIAFIALIVFYTVYRRMHFNFSDEAFHRLGNAMTLICVCGVCILIGAFVYFSFINTTVSLGRLENYLRFGTKWGTGRGTIWSWCMDMFSDYSIKDKLFGTGHGTVPQLLKDMYWDDMRTQLGYYFDNAHNFFLHQLLTIGIVGVASYAVLLLGFIIRGLKKPQTAGAAMAVIVYIVVGMVCICEPISEPYIWVMFGLILRGEKIIREIRYT